MPHFDLHLGSAPFCREAAFSAEQCEREDAVALLRGAQRAGGGAVQRARGSAASERDGFARTSRGLPSHSKRLSRADWRKLRPPMHRASLERDGAARLESCAAWDWGSKAVRLPLRYNFEKKNVEKFRSHFCLRWAGWARYRAGRVTAIRRSCRARRSSPRHRPRRASADADP
jgi:hypothetical protein